MPGPPVPTAIFLTSFEPGGTERQMIELVKRLDPRRFTVHVVCLHRRGAWLSQAASHAASVTEFSIESFTRSAAWRQMTAFARWCRRREIAVLHTCDFYSNVFGLLGGALAGVPVRVGSRRGFNHDRTPAQLALQRLACRTAHRIAANSEAVAARVRTDGIAAGRIAIVPNGVDVGVFASPRVRASRPRVIMVANLRQGKGHEDLIEAAVSVACAHPRVDIQVVGDGPRRRELTELVRARALEDHVRFLGYREDVAALLAASDIFVLPSWSEAFPNAVIEAMAAGLPVVATRTGGIPELVDHRVTGVLVPPRDPAMLAQALVEMLNRPRWADGLGRAARRSIEDRYSFDRMVGAFEELYLSALAERRPELSPAPGRVSEVA